MEVGKSTLCCMSPNAIMQLYRPGSYDEPWSWDDEMNDLISRNELDGLTTDIQENGIREPVILGDDGRVWEGHHRICIAHRLGMTDVPYKWGFTR